MSLTLTYAQHNEDGSIHRVTAQADGHLAAWRLLILTLQPDSADLDDSLNTTLSSFHGHLHRVLGEAIRWLNHMSSTTQVSQC